MATASSTGNAQEPAPGTDGTVRLYGGDHCETSAFRKALHAHGLGLSEEMLLGLGGGIGFMYVPKAPGSPPSWPPGTTRSRSSPAAWPRASAWS
ncbi:BtrH N-terminal domain-containing protein [Streptomyces rhizosphaericus]|uniref:BtrH N-terminal domain-containing protein n=1 Tax=Streptomyces rhizosphaericus TaxID=114699 RepID=UPI0036435E62